MKVVIDIDENVFTRLFDNGIEDYAIVNDDLFAIAKSLRKGTPLDVLDKIFSIVHPLSIMSTDKLEHEAIMQIAEMLEPLCLLESEDEG